MKFVFNVKIKKYGQWVLGMFCLILKTIRIHMKFMKICILCK